MLANQAHRSREESAIVEMWHLNMDSKMFPVTSAILWHVHILQGPPSFVGYSLTSPMRSGRGGTEGESRAVEVVPVMSKRDLKKK